MILSHCWWLDGQIRRNMVVTWDCVQYSAIVLETKRWFLCLCNLYHPNSFTTFHFLDWLIGIRLAFVVESVLLCYRCLCTRSIDRVTCYAIWHPHFGTAHYGTSFEVPKGKQTPKHSWYCQTCDKMKRYSSRVHILRETHTQTQRAWHPLVFTTNFCVRHFCDRRIRSSDPGIIATTKTARWSTTNTDGDRNGYLCTTDDVFDAGT